MGILIVRELTGGVYFGEPKEIVTLEDGNRRAVDTQIYNTIEVARIARTAFDFARKRPRKMVTSVENCAMQLVRSPKQFDVLLCDNLFGDILSDLAAMLTGSIGMLPSASFGAMRSDRGLRSSLYEPAHGSAPNIAGRGIANPIAMIASFGMALRYSLDLPHVADAIDTSISRLLAKGIFTADISEPGRPASTTRDVGEALLVEMRRASVSSTSG